MCNDIFGHWLKYFFLPIIRDSLGRMMYYSFPVVFFPVCVLNNFCVQSLMNPLSDGKNLTLSNLKEFSDDKNEILNKTLNLSFMQ